MQLKFLPSSVVKIRAVMATVCASASCTQSNQIEILLTPIRIHWIRNQCEAMVNEIEAIINQNVYQQFNIVSNLRYIELYDALELVASKRIPELDWVYKKMKAYASQSLYQSVVNVITVHLLDLDRRLVQIEATEPRGQAVAPNKQWMQAYDSHLYFVEFST